MAPSGGGSHFDELRARAAPIATAGAVTAVTHQWESQRKADEAQAAHILKQAKEHASMYDVPPDHISYHVLPASGGASGVAESIVKYVKGLTHPVLVIGNRGYGSFKRAMMSFVGLGSVSDYCVHRTTSPVIVVKSAAESAPDAGVSDAPYKMCVCVDDSEIARDVLRYACAHIYKPDMQLHVISVAQPVSMPLIDETSAGIAPMLAKQWEDEKKVVMKNAESACAKAVDIVSEAGVPEKSVFWKALQPEGGASEVAQSIVHYCAENHVNLTVVGSHGFSAFTRGMRGLVGLGSVSDYCLHHLKNVVCLVKPSGVKEDA